MNITKSICWNLIDRQVQTAIWVKQENESCRVQNAENKLFSVCATTDDSQPSWKTPLENCMRTSGAPDNIQKLPSRRERLSAYSKSLQNLGQSNFP